MHNLPNAWSLPRPWTLHPIDGGANNLSYLLETPQDRYVLRIYQNTADHARIAYEHALLTQLEQSGLSFAVPSPVPTRTGATLAEVPDPTRPALAALFHFIPGRHAEAGNLMQCHAGGAALAELDQALAHIAIQPPPGTLPPFGDLYHIHPSVPDPLAMLEELPLEEVDRAHLLQISNHLRATTPILYDSLPQQTVHRDFDGSNILLEESRVTGVLDFEFAHPDLRAVDFAYAVYQFTVAAWGTEAGAQLINAFATGYFQRLPLTTGEIEALPDLMRLYRMVTLIHRAGRRRQGLAREEAVLLRVRSLLELDKSLKERRTELLSVIYDAAP